jgi:galactonate dehydratase
MKVTRVEVLRASWFLWARVHTDEGLTGVGDLHGGSGGVGDTIAVRSGVEMCADYLVGKNPLEIEKHWQHMFRRCLFRGGADLMAAIGGIDMALWDIAGKAYGLPVHRLIGGPVRDRVKVSGMLRGESLGEITDNAREMKELGYKALKFYPMPPFQQGIPDSYLGVVRRIVSYVEAVRLAVGPDIDLLIDVVCRLTPPEAIAVGHAIAPYGVYYFEDPIEPDNIDAMAEVAARQPIPIATGERLYTIYQFKELLDKKAAAYVRPDPSTAGGITQLKKIAAQAEAAYVGVVPHNPCTPVMTAANLQLCAAIPNVPVLEYFGDEHVPPKSEVIVEPARFENGFVHVPQTPGLGIELNEKALGRFPPVKHFRAPVVMSDGSLRDY